MKKKILVLGATGLLGTSIERVFKNDKNYKYIGCAHEDIDITNKKKLEKLLNQYKPHYVINSVALIGINYCESNPEKTLNVNALSVYNLAKICKNNNIILVQISTHAVFDGKKNQPYHEKDNPNPLNIYAHSKLISEYFVKQNLEKYFILRMPTMYGPRRNKTLGFVDKMIGMMKQGKSLKIAFDRIDSPSYAFNIAKKINNIIKSKNYGTYHVYDKGAISYHEFISEIANKIKFKKKIKKTRHKDFKAAAPNPLRVAMKSKTGCTGVFWKTAINNYIKDENIKC
jgi:dTDP-4-dehydrorhamnose reductase